MNAAPPNRSTNSVCGPATTFPFSSLRPAAVRNHGSLLKQLKCSNCFNANVWAQSIQSEKTQCALIFHNHTAEYLRDLCTTSRYSKLHPQLCNIEMVGPCLWFIYLFIYLFIYFLIFFLCSFCGLEVINHLNILFGIFFFLGPLDSKGCEQTLNWASRRREKKKKKKLFLYLYGTNLAVYRGIILKGVIKLQSASSLVFTASTVQSLGFT